MKSSHRSHIVGPLLIAVLVFLLIGCRSTDPQTNGKAAEAPPADESEGLVTAGDGSIAVEFIAEPTEISAGEQVALRIVNRGEVGLEFGRPIMIERWEDGEWVETEESRNTMWTMELLYAMPGQEGVEQVWPFQPDPQPEPGWYRFTKYVSPEGANQKPSRLPIRVQVRLTE